MKTIQISDELYQSLKRFLVDPFDDTPEIIIGRLIDIAEKAQNRWSAWDNPDGTVPPADPGDDNRCVNADQEVEQEVEQPVIL